MLYVCAQAEELAKQQKFMEATRDIHHHMLEQMREQEEMRREQADLDQNLLKQRIIQDQKVAFIIIRGAPGNCCMLVTAVSQSAAGEGTESSERGQTVARIS